MDENELITSKEAAVLMARDGKPVSRQIVSAKAKRYGWPRQVGKGEGCPFLYRRSDILEYVAQRGPVTGGRPKKASNQ